MRTIIVTAPRFSLGQVVATQGAAHSLTPAEIAEAITRHAARDWGEVCREDSEANDWSIANGERVLSAYTFRDERCWVITEADRSVTTVLLPDEY